MDQVQVSEEPIGLKGKYFSDQSKNEALQSLSDEEREEEDFSDLRSKEYRSPLSWEERRERTIGKLARQHFGMDV